ncbi:transglycosylase SLT domain-containing protein [Uliginosibacterium sp. 31-12]|uniref:transglycosylase SLT domain-containing protein n=1 Tax=Uliginosibacterium sp. 31-12 TaxID=3062781 RepID=UPI0026E13C86|nr:transglycosylase SLT domain-containing protein [Uliginosibacterium sp. 31-12]MDO6385162.1 transglycosylase SLT domain-containing protein [Uliginosibacterium sp. 31-12]
MISRLLTASLSLLCLCGSPFLHAAEPETVSLQFANALTAPAPAVGTTANSEGASTPVTTELPQRTPINTGAHAKASSDLWDRIRKGFGIPNLVDNPNVDRHIAAFQARPQAITNLMERGSKYLYHIVSELEARGMPTELALLPLVESAYNPMAFSPAKAAGLWQFIPSTGRDFRLQQNWWVDERRDVLASTAAALTYLQAVYELQGDWHLALASYNWGENAVLRAVNSNRNAGRPTDYNSLRMPKETAQYVPKLQAVKMIVANPERYGLRLPPIPDEPYFVTVERDQGMDVALAAKFAEMPLNEFLALNPAYNRPIIPGNHDADLILPVDNARKFSENFAAHGGPLLSWKTYSLPRGARVEQVAQSLKLSPDALRSANGLPPRAKLAAGYTLLVPHATDITAPIETAETSKPGVQNKSSSRAPSPALNKAAARAPAKKTPTRRG